MKLATLLVNALLMPVAVLASVMLVACAVLDADYLSGAAARSGAYDRASSILPTVVTDWAAGDLTEQERDRLRGVLAELLTPSYLSEHVTRTLHEIDAVVHGHAFSAELHFDELPARARALGRVLPEDRFRSIEVTATELQSQIQLLDTFEKIGWAAFAGCAVLVTLSLALCRKRGSHRGLGATLLVAAVGMALVVSRLQAGPDGTPVAAEPPMHPLGIILVGSATELVPLFGLVWKRVLLEGRIALAVMSGLAAVVGMVLLGRGSRTRPGQA